MRIDVERERPRLLDLRRQRAHQVIARVVDAQRRGPAERRDVAAVREGAYGVPRPAREVRSWQPSADVEAAAGALTVDVEDGALVGRQVKPEQCAAAGRKRERLVYRAGRRKDVEPARKSLHHEQIAV